jgi:hypothetical protein
VLVKWENGEITTEPLSVIAADNPVTCDVYSREHDLLDVEGWKRFRNLAKRCIVGHQGPLLRHDKDYNGSRFNVLVKWENGEITTEPLLVIAADNPVTCDVYAREHDLLDVEGWKRFRNLAKRAKHFLRLIKQAKMKSYHQSMKYKFGYRIPKDYKEALKLDELNQNTKWEDATVTEMSQLKEYECFIDAGIYARRFVLILCLTLNMVDAIKHATLQVGTLPTFLTRVSTPG